MIILKKYICFIFLILAQFASVAQYTGVFNPKLDEKSNRPKGKLQGEVFYLSMISNANHFLQKDWVNGTIVLKDGDIFENVRMRYMAYGDELVAYNNDIKTLLVVDKNTVKEFIFKVSSETGTSTEIKFINLDSLNLPNNRSYFQWLYSGKAKLLCFHQIEEEKVNPYNGIDGKKYDTEFRLKSMYYIWSNEKDFSRIQLNNRSLCNLFPENKKAIKKMFRKNRINISNEKSAIQAVELLDSEGFFK